MKEREILEIILNHRIMTENIKTNLNNPEILEKLYRNDRRNFKAAFDQIYHEIESSDSAKFWRARLDYDNKPEILKTISLAEIMTVVAVGIIISFFIKIPALFHFGYSEEIYYMKNAAIIVFSGLVLYTILMKKLQISANVYLTAVVILIPVLYINLLPSAGSDSENLAYIHLPFLMWFIYGIVFTGYEFRNLGRRIDFIRYNGDLAIVYALIAIAGGILTAITIGLFESIGISIEKFYMQNIVMTGAAAAPVLAVYLIEKFPAIVSRAATLIAMIFSPLVLITLAVFLVTMIFSGKDPYNDRDFLLVFNVMLLGVMGIIIFSVSETSIIKNQKINSIILFVLSIVTIVIDLIALSAIFYRLGDGLTPNRLAVLVSNLLVLINLILMMKELFRVNFKNAEFRTVETAVSKFLPVYLVWIVIVVFGFPLIF